MFGLHILTTSNSLQISSFNSSFRNLFLSTEIGTMLWGTTTFTIISRQFAFISLLGSKSIFPSNLQWLLLVWTCFQYQFAAIVTTCNTYLHALLSLRRAIITLYDKTFSVIFTYTIVISDLFFYNVIHVIFVGQVLMLSSYQVAFNVSFSIHASYEWYKIVCSL